VKDILPLSGKLIPDFDGRQSIRDMFKRNPTLSMERSLETTIQSGTDLTQEYSSAAITNLDIKSPASEAKVVDYDSTEGPLSPRRPATAQKALASSFANSMRPPLEKQNIRPLKRVKLNSTASPAPNQTKGQQSLKGFFKPKSTGAVSSVNVLIDKESSPEQSLLKVAPSTTMMQQEPLTSSTGSMLSETAFTHAESEEGTISRSMPMSLVSQSNRAHPDAVHDPIESKESWTRLFNKREAPRCEGHNEPCISLVTKKNGINCGRSFWMCNRPLGPSGIKEKGTQWRCQTFVWCSDWNSNVD